MTDEVRGLQEGDGYAVGNLEALGDGPGFRKIRQQLGVEEFGVNAIVLPPGIETGFHFHEKQEELYFVHSGTIEIEFGDGSAHVLGPGGLARVAAPTHRKVKTVGESEAVYVVVGAKGGYIGHDGQRPEGEPRLRESDAPGAGPDPSR